MGKLNRTPEGFLDLTGQQVGGRYPTEISDVAVPTIPLFPLVAARKQATEFAISLTSNLFDTATIEVPQGENWLMYQCSSFVAYTTPVIPTERVKIGAYLTNLPDSSSAANFVYIMGTPQVTEDNLAGNATSLQTAHFDEPIALPPGSQIVGRVEDTNTNVAWFFQVGIYRLTGN